LDRPLRNRRLEPRRNPRAESRACHFLDVTFLYCISFFVRLL